jgi:hypothetical protein
VGFFAPRFQRDQGGISARNILPTLFHEQKRFTIHAYIEKLTVFISPFLPQKHTWALVMKRWPTKRNRALDHGDSGIYGPQDAAVAHSTMPNR